MIPSPFFLGFLQTWIHTVPFPLTFPLKVGEVPTGTVAPFLGAVGVMPFLVAACAAEAPMRSAAEHAARMNTRYMGPDRIRSRAGMRTAAVDIGTNSTRL